MNIVVPVRLVPDLGEEINVDPGGTALDASWLRLIINEFDDQAIEQAILLKERGGGQVCILAPSVEGVDDVLFTAAAKGADRLVKLEGLTDVGLSSHALARALAPAIPALPPDLIPTRAPWRGARCPRPCRPPESKRRPPARSMRAAPSRSSGCSSPRRPAGRP